MTQSLRRKMAQRAQAGASTSTLRAIQAQSRTGQVSRTTITVGDNDVFVDDMLANAAGTSETVEFQEEELDGSRDISDDVVDVLPDMTEDNWDAVDFAQEAFENADLANENVTIAMEAAEEAARQAAEVSEVAQGAATAAEQASADAEAAVTAAANASAAAAQAQQDAVTKSAEAEQAAKEYAAAQAAAAKSAAEAAASDDATLKAQAAEDAAKLAAAADAKAKADAAQAAAEQKAAEAKAAADAAATEATDAKNRAIAARELALQNARYRQVDGEAITPAEPEGGFRVNAQLVRVTATGFPYQVDRWSGTAWVRDQVLADQILVPSENGTIAIGDATIYAPYVIGGKFVGNQFEGLEFALPTVTSMTEIVNDTFESTVSPWTRFLTEYTLPTRSTAQAQAGTASMLLGRSGTGFGARRAFASTSFPTGGYAELWVRRSVAGAVSIRSNDADMATPFPNVPANTWTLLRREIPPGAVASEFSMSGSIATSGTVYVDGFRIVRYNSGAGKAALDRNPAGEARLYTSDAAGNMAELREGRAVSTFPNTGQNMTFSSEIAPVASGGFGTLGIEHQLRQVTSTGVKRVARVALNSFGLMQIYNGTETDVASGSISVLSDIGLNGQVSSSRSLPVLFTSPGVYMNANQTVSLGSAVANCLNGIILVWSEYTSGASVNAQWNFTYIPKVWNSGGGISCPLTGFADQSGARKYIYFDGQTIRGHNNNTSGAAGNFVLRFVYGY